VLIQTALPQHYAIRSAVTHDYAAFAERELAERVEPGYPPHARLVNVVISGTAENEVQDAASAAAGWVLDLMQRHAAGRDLTLTGPAPCPIDRIRDRWRWHFLLRSHSAAVLGAACRQLHTRYVLRPGRADLRLIVDRDPVSLL
jgi:primosomal protein N' (replication factor Y) (superfamily II helicase)